MFDDNIARVRKVLTEIVFSRKIRPISAEAVNLDFNDAPILVLQIRSSRPRFRLLFVKELS